MKTLTREQSYKLRRLAERVARFCKEKYTVKLLHVQPWKNICPGHVEIITRTKDTYERMLRILENVVPGVKLAYERGLGWHYLDKTEYHYGFIGYIIERD